MDPFDPDAIIHVLSRCEACQLGQVGTRVCVEKGHMATVASVKRSERGANFVDPYTEEEVDARYRLMLKPGESLSILSTNAVIDGTVKFAPGTVFQQPPNTKSQTLLGCLKQGIPLQDFVLGGASAAKKEKDTEGDHEHDRGAKRKAPPSLISVPTKKSPVAPVVTVNKPPPSASEQAAASGVSGISSQYFSSDELDEVDALDEDSGAGTPGSGRSSKRQGTRSGAGLLGVERPPRGAEGADSARQLELLAEAEADLRRSYDEHIKFLDEAEEAKKAELAAFQQAAELALRNIERSRQCTNLDGQRQHKAFRLQRQRITRLRMEEVDQERARNQMESEKREARLKAEKEALARACEAEAEQLGNAWAVVEAAAGFAPSEGSSVGGHEYNGDKMHQLAAAAAAGAEGEHGSASSSRKGNIGSDVNGDTSGVDAGHARSGGGSVGQ